jgi:hypothetical protein
MSLQILKKIFPLLVLSSMCSAQPRLTADDAFPLHRAQKILTSIIVHDIFSPPVSSRIYAYSHISAYETFIQQNSSYVSLYGQIKNFPKISAPEKPIDIGLSGVYAFLQTGKKLVFSEKVMEDSIQRMLQIYRKKIPKKLFEESIRYGKQVSEIILTWARLDQYDETRKIQRYNFLKQEGKWIPTPPTYMAAVEPNWKKIRPFSLDSGNQFSPIPPPAFSREKNTEFYLIAHEVYQTGRQLTQEQKDIANFWDCNPFAVNVHGHVNYATKKLSPGGHWLSIAAIASQKTNAGLVQASAAYTLTSIALFDGFISCWDEKYRSNLIRPETYINAYIDEKWHPLLQTPPFPEYTSGHSVISTASAVVLTAFFGDNFSFVDTSESEYGYRPRTFKSFFEACNEAAISRMYGGIHYMPAISQGQLQGKKIGEQVLLKVRLSRSQP